MRNINNQKEFYEKQYFPLWLRILILASAIISLITALYFKDIELFSNKK